MAEQRPYRLPGASADERLTRAKRIALLALGAAFLAINQVTTQHAARVLRYAVRLGSPLIHFNKFSIYAPWAWIIWGPGGTGRRSSNRSGSNAHGKRFCRWVWSPGSSAAPSH